jgi:hypothetical protein
MAKSVRAPHLAPVPPCCQRSSGRVDDEGNDLLLNSERGAGGVVVSKEEVPVGKRVSQKKEEPSSELIAD